MKDLIIILGCLFFFIACNKEEDGELKPTETHRDWFVAYDDPDDPLKHEIYLTYEAFKVPVFVDDTIGVEVRVDPYGNSYTHYEVLDVFYKIDQGKYLKDTCIESGNVTDLRNGVKLIKEYVLPLIPFRIAPMSYLLVEELYARSTKKSSYFNGMQTTVVGNISYLKDMSREEWKALGAEIAGVDFAQYVMEEYEKELLPFYKVSNDVYGSKVYDQSLSGRRNPPFLSTPPEEYGMLILDETSTLTQEKDIIQFIKQVLLGDKKAFMEKYKEWPLVKQKYEMMETLMNKALEEIKNGGKK